MADCPIQKGMLKNADEEVRLEGHYRGKNKFLALFLICCAVLIAGFAVTAMWGDGGADWLKQSLGGATPPAKDTEERDDATFDTTESVTEEQTEAPSVPSDAIGVVSMDLSCADRAELYINNESIHSPSIDALLALDLSSEITDAPLVLILHTHTSESYLSAGETYLLGSLGATTYSQDDSRNVIAVGSVLCETLNQEGIPTVHCKITHDGDERVGAYTKAMKSIRFFLSHYPSIRYVIDLHRDSILTENGEYVRAVTEIDAQATAQVMSVVGSDGGGSPCENWEGNLALALQLRKRLNADGTKLCRPVTLRNSTYNQELAPYSLLLEIGTGANTTEEAKRAAVRVGTALAQLIKGK